MRISDWSSDVCSSDLLDLGCGARDRHPAVVRIVAADENDQRQRDVDEAQQAGAQIEPMQADEAAPDPPQPGTRRLDARRSIARRALPPSSAHHVKRGSGGQDTAYPRARTKRNSDV